MGKPVGALEEEKGERSSEAVCACVCAHVCVFCDWLKVHLCCSPVTGFPSFLKLNDIPL